MRFSGEDAARTDTIYVSRSIGKDKATCGPQQFPCYSISQAIRVSQWSDQIYIDSTNSKSNPYNCSTVSSPWIHVNKSLSFSGYPFMAHLACQAGFYFDGQNNTQLHIEFTRLCFTSTRLTFVSSSVKMSNCFIQHNKLEPGVKFLPDQRQQTLFIKNTTFLNNSGQCIEIHSSTYMESKSGFAIVILTIHDTIFSSNDLPSTSFSSGIISVRNTHGAINDTIVSSFVNVKFVGNTGTLLLFNNSKGNFQGYYSNIHVQRNMKGESTSDGGDCSLFEMAGHTVNLSFVEVLFASNNGCRCLAIDANRITLKVRRGRFEEQKIDGNGAALLVRKSQRLFVNIEDTKFVDCQGIKGGALSLGQKNKKIHFTARNVLFDRCRASDSGGAMLADGNDVELTVENVTFIECVADTAGAGGIKLKVANLSLSLLFTVWKAGNSIYGAALSVSVTGNYFISIGNSEFDDEQLDPSAISLPTVGIYARRNKAGSLQIYDSKFYNSPDYALWTINTISVNLTRVYFTRTSNFAISIIVTSTLIMHTRAHVFIDDCVFENNTDGINLILQEAKLVKVTIKNSIFLKFSVRKESDGGPTGGHAIRITTFTEMNCLSAFVQLENLLVEENRFKSVYSADAAVYVDLRNFLARDGNTVKIINSRFIKNENLETDPTSDKKAGALLVVMPADNMTSPGCVTENIIHRKWLYKNQLLIVNTSFENNIGPTGALYISNGDTRCINCLFKDNVVASRSGQVHIGDNSGKLELINSSFLETRAVWDFFFGKNKLGNNYQTSTFISSYGAGPLIITGTTMKSDVRKQNSRTITISKGGDLSMGNASFLLCPSGSKLVREDFSHFVTTEYRQQSCKISLTVVTLSCQTCPGGTYSLQRGNTRNISAITEGFRCLSCPYGAKCDRNVVAQKNFWGYEMPHNPPQLQFVTCPAGYCITPDSLDTSVYNGCFGKRDGTLCGKCKHGYTDDLFSTLCIEETKCDSWLFWGLLLLFSFLVALYFLLQPIIFRFIHNHIMWFRKREDGNEVMQGNAGYTKIVFYFYQIAAILLLETYVELIREDENSIHDYLWI